MNVGIDIGTSSFLLVSKHLERLQGGSALCAHLYKNFFTTQFTQAVIKSDRFAGAFEFGDAPAELCFIDHLAEPSAQRSPQFHC